MAKSDLIIGTRSTVLLEALLLDKKVITIISKQFGDIDDFSKMGVYNLASDEYELLSILNDSNKLKNNEHNVLNFINKYFYKIDGKVCDRVMEQI
ncbi:hypothetical protein [Clostridium sporogenes]|uniref:hypothetical protein n=1 Tax=Clostridium sporogenes TaxID=1509 RepID=UPI000B2A6AC3|nr:hypothetical protein [Clostridium sporogenes]